MRLPSHLRLSRHGIWYFRIVLPDDLAALLGQKEIRRTLGTRCPETAKHAAYRLSGTPTCLSAHLRSGSSKPSSGTQTFHWNFFRRVMFRTVKYALLYHLILGKNTTEIDAEDIGWACRLCRQQLNDAKRMLAGSLSDLNRMIEAAEALRDRLAAKGAVSIDELRFHLADIRVALTGRDE